MGCVFPAFDQLSAEQRRLLGGRDKYDDLEPELKAGFLNITSALAWLGIGTAGMLLKPQKKPATETSGIQQDRLVLEPNCVDNLKKQLDEHAARKERYGDKGFVKDRPDCREHPGMCDWGGRQWVTTASLQIGGGRAGAFIDIDEFGVKTDLVGVFGHAFEVVRNKVKRVKTDPYRIGRKLGRRFKLPYVCE